jgi:hypothetical protein
MIGYENLGIKRNENEKSYRKYSENSDTKTCDESFNKSIQKNERHVTFQTNFLIVIDVESWRKYNIDVTEKDANWYKVISEPEERNIEKILNKKITPVYEDCIKNDKQLNSKKEKLSCQCAVF